MMSSLTIASSFVPCDSKPCFSRQSTISLVDCLREIQRTRSPRRYRIYRSLPNEESEANVFAGEFLVPRSMVAPALLPNKPTFRSWCRLPEWLTAEARASHNKSSLRRIGLACLRIELRAQLTEFNMKVLADRAGLCTNAAITSAHGVGAG